MPFTKTLFSTVLLLFVVQFYTIAQPKKVKKITKEMLEEQQHPTYIDASAQVIYQSGSKKLDFQEGFFFENKFHRIVKFYKKTGFDYATFKIPIRKNNQGQENKILELKLTTYNLENGKIVKQSIRSNEGYIIDKNDDKEFVITATNLKEGSVVEIEYTFMEFRLTYTEFWPFQQAIPVRSSVFSFEVPDFVQFKEIIKPKEKIQVSKDTRRQKIASTALSGGGGFGNIFELKLNKNTYWTEHLSPLEKDDFSGIYYNYLVGVQHNLISITPPNYQLHRFFNKSWEDLATYFDESELYGVKTKKWDAFLRNNPVFVAKEDSSEIEKMNEIFRHVQQHMRSNEKYGLLTEEKLAKIYEAREAKPSQINMILTGLLRANGIQANNLVLATNDMGELKEPNIGQINKSISIAYINGQAYVLDASDTSSLPNLIHPKHFNGKSLEVGANQFFEVHEMRPNGISQKNTEIYFNLNEHAAYTGKFHQQLTNYEALLAKGKSGINNQGSLVDINEIIPFPLDKVNLLNQDDESILELKGEFDSEILNSGTANLITVQPFEVLRNELENPFTSAERKIPAIYPFPIYHTYEVSVQIPENFRLVSLPENKKVTLPDFAGNLKIEYSAEENQVVSKITFQINTTEIPVKRFSKLYEMYEIKSEAINESLLLERVE